MSNNYVFLTFAMMALLAMTAFGIGNADLFFEEDRSSLFEMVPYRAAATDEEAEMSTRLSAVESAADSGHVTRAPAVPVSPAQASSIYKEFPFFSIYESATFSLCHHQLYYQCIPALRATEHNWVPKFQTWSTHCLDDYCVCLPEGKIKIENGVRKCSYRRPANGVEHCSVIEECLPLKDQCVQRFILTKGNMPQNCTPFLDCAALDDVRRANLLECEEYREKVAPGCDHALTCRFIPSANTYEPSSVSPRHLSYTTLVVVIISCVVCIPLLVCGTYTMSVYRRHRMRAQLRAMEDDAALNERFVDDETMLRRNAPLVAWYGDELHVNIPLAPADNAAEPPDGAAAVSTASPTTGASCAYCGAQCGVEHHRMMVLPCRCQWCGDCDDPRKVGSASGGAATGEKKLCRQCGAEVQHILDLGKVFCTSAVASPTAETAAGDAGSQDDDIPLMPIDTSTPSGGANGNAGVESSKVLCSICLEEEASVVFLPCNHLSACSGCARTVTNIVTRRRGRYVAPRCHMCRTPIDAAVVLPSTAITATKRTSSESSSPAGAAVAVRRPDDASSLPENPLTVSDDTESI